MTGYNNPYAPGGRLPSSQVNRYYGNNNDYRSQSSSAAPRAHGYLQSTYLQRPNHQPQNPNPQQSHPQPPIHQQQSQQSQQSQPAQYDHSQQHLEETLPQSKNLQQEIEDLRRKLEEKEEENFDLSASLMSIQVETKDQIDQVEQTSKQQISRLEEELRRTQQEANRARAALKKQQQTNPPLPDPQIDAPQTGQCVTATPAAANVGRPLSQGSRPIIPSTNISPSSRHPTGTRAAAPETTDLNPRIPPNQYAPINKLAQNLLHELPLGNDRVHIALTQLTLQGRGREDDFLWCLVKESVDYSNLQAFNMLHTFLLWSPKGCQALLLAAGWETQEPADGKAFNPSRVTIRSTTIRLNASADQRQKARLESIAAKLHRPLALSSPNTAAISNGTGSNGSTTPFTPKQELLARQLWMGLIDAIFPKGGHQRAPFPHRESLRILTQLLSTIRHHRPPMGLLEPILVRVESRLRAHRESLKGDHGETHIRGYDPLKPHYTQGEDTNDAKQCKSPPPSLPLNELDPMLTELCHQLGRLVPEVAADFEDDPTQDFVFQWRKAVLANACDLLEGRLLPLLLTIVGQENTTIKAPFEEAWSQWIPWMTSLVQEEQGRQLLRIQFPLIAADSASPLSSEKARDVSCSAMGVVMQLLYASVMVTQSRVGVVDRSILILCETLRDQAVRCIHSWLQCYKSRQSGEISFFDLVSEFSEYYKSACAWILHQHETDPENRKAIDPDIATMIKQQWEELVLDEEDILAEREEKYAGCSKNGK